MPGTGDDLHTDGQSVKFATAFAQFIGISVRYNGDEVKREYVMAAQRIVDMTLDDLNQLIEQTVDRRLGLVKSEDTRPMSEVNQSIRQHRWTPPPGSKSTLELLREDRDA